MYFRYLMLLCKTGPVLDRMKLAMRVVEHVVVGMASMRAITNGRYEKWVAVIGHFAMHPLVHQLVHRSN